MRPRILLVTIISLLLIPLMLIATISIAADFGPNSATLTHKYFPMKHGDKLIYRSYGFPEVFEFTLEALSAEIIDSVECLKIVEYFKIYDSAIYIYYWFAEGITGNIWLLKEFDSDSDETTFYGKKNAKLIIECAHKLKIAWQ